MVNIDIESNSYSESRNYGIEFSTVVNGSDKIVFENLLRNAGRVDEIKTPLTSSKHYDTTPNTSNTVSFTINNAPTGITTTIEVMVESYSIQLLSNNPEMYRIQIRGFTE